MAWSYFNPVRVVAGEGSLQGLRELVPADGKLLLVTTEGWVRRGAVARVLAQFDQRRVVVHAGVTPNPQLDELEQVAAAHASAAPTAILALGGGSAIDTGKVLSITMAGGSPAGLRDLLAEGGTDAAWRRAIPMVAVPTTAGSGAEVTPFATVWDAGNRRKHSLANSALYPSAAVLDPELTLSLGADDTLYSGLDAISHALESLWNRNRSPVSEAHATRALELAVEALPLLLGSREPDMASRFRMQGASLLAGLAISQTRTAIAHSISYPLTAHFNVPHGLACSFTLSRILDSHLEANPEPDHRPLLLRVKQLLEGLDLGARLATYVDQSQLDGLKAEMIHKGRADNFTGRVDLDRFVSM